MDSFNPDRFRLPRNPIDQSKSPIQERLAERRVTPRQKAQRFLKGPVPLSWLMVAAQLSGKALAVGIALWFRSGLERSSQVRLPTTLLTLFGIDRHAKARAIDALEKASLIAVERRKGKNPVITILDAPERL